MIARLVCLVRGHVWIIHREHWFDGYPGRGYLERGRQWKRCLRCGRRRS